MPAPMPKASNLVRDTLMPDAAAARSLARTARNRRPVPLRRMLHTATQATISAISTKMVNAGRSATPWSPTDDEVDAEERRRVDVRRRAGR